MICYEVINSSQGATNFIVVLRLGKVKRNWEITSIGSRKVVAVEVDRGKGVGLGCMGGGERSAGESDDMEENKCQSVLWG